MAKTHGMRQSEEQCCSHVIGLLRVVPDSHPCFSFPHHESRVGKRYNAIVPDFDEAVARDVQNGSEESITSGFVYGVV